MVRLLYTSYHHTRERISRNDIFDIYIEVIRNIIEEVVHVTRLFNLRIAVIKLLF